MNTAPPLVNGSIAFFLHKFVLFFFLRNPPHPTIEEELLRSFRDAGSIAPEWFEAPQKAFFQVTGNVTESGSCGGKIIASLLLQRASRTDKGVSAARMVVSLKMRE